MYRLRRGLGTVDASTINVNSSTFGVIGNPDAVPPASANMATPPSTQYEDLLAAGNPGCTCQAGTCVETGDSCSGSYPASTSAAVPAQTMSETTAWVIAAAVAIFGLMVMGGGSARRYGR